MEISYVPKTWREAVELKEVTESIPLAGGTDLMVKKKNYSGLLPRFEEPVLFIGQIKEIQQINRMEKNLHIGAGCTFYQLLKEEQVPSILKETVRQIASPAIRNRGTLGGNICNASPAGDTIPILYALDAKIKVVSVGKERCIPISDFIAGPGKTILENHELVKEIILPVKEFSIQYYRKVGSRKADAISKLSFVGLAKMRNSRIENFKAAFGAVGPTVIQKEEIEDQIIGMGLKDIGEKIPFIKEEYGQWIRPIDDQRSTAEYRKTVALRILEDFLSQIQKNIQ